MYQYNVENYQGAAVFAAAHAKGGRDIEIIYFDAYTGTRVGHSSGGNFATAMMQFEYASHIADGHAPVTGMFVFDNGERIEVGRIPLAAYACHTLDECDREIPVWGEAPKKRRAESVTRFRRFCGA